MQFNNEFYLNFAELTTRSWQAQFLIALIFLAMAVALFEGVHVAALLTVRAARRVLLVVTL